MRVLLVASLVGVAACSGAQSDAGNETPSSAASTLEIPPPASATALPVVVASAAPAPSSVTASHGPLAAKSASGCEVVVEELVDSQVYRGSPSSQMKWDSYARDPAYARMAQGMDHGAHYLSCTWVLRVNGKRYKFERASHGGPSSIRLEPSACSERSEAEETAADVHAFTDQCKDLHRGEYYGDFLVPL